MINMTKELKKKLLAAQSAEEVAELVKADGQELTAEDNERIWEEITKRREKDVRTLSLDELEAVSGGSEYRNWPVDGCAASVEPDSMCWSNDACSVSEVEYTDPPIDNIGIWDVSTCPDCGGYLYFFQYLDAAKHQAVVRCPRCGHKHIIETHLF